MAANQTKKDAVAELVIKLKAAKTVVLADYRGLSAVEADELRKITREAGVEYFVAKNRLFKLALEEVGYESDFGTDLKGTTAFALSSDAVAPAKAIFDFGMAKKGKLTIKAGLLDGKKMTAQEVEALAKLPSRDQLLSMVLNSMLGPIRKLAYVTTAIIDKKEA